MALGLQEGEFWDLTPLQYNALREQWKLEQRRKDLRAAKIEARLMMLLGHKAVTIEDLLPDYDGTKAVKESPKMADEQIKAKVMRMDAVLRNNPQRRKR